MSKNNYCEIFNSRYRGSTVSSNYEEWEQEIKHLDAVEPGYPENQISLSFINSPYSIATRIFLPLIFTCNTYYYQDKKMCQRYIVYIDIYKSIDTW